MRKLIVLCTTVFLLHPVSASAERVTKVKTGGSTSGAKGIAKARRVTRVATFVKVPVAPVRAGIACSVAEAGSLSPNLGMALGKVTPDGARWGPGTRTCEDKSVRFGVFCLENCPVDPLTGLIIIRRPTADDARALLPKVLPIPRLSPPLEKVEDSNIGGYLVGMSTYFGVDPDNWTTPLEATAEAGPYKMHVTAQPIELRVSVNGVLVETCKDSDPIDYVGENWRTTSNKCKFVFTDTGNGEAKVSLQIIYKHTYTPTPPEDAVFPINELGASQVNTFDIPLVEVQPVIKSVK
jgi:hypothetical protein